MKEEDLNRCKKCYKKEHIEVSLHNGNHAFSGLCGKSINFKNYVRTEQYEPDLPHCPKHNWKSDIQYVEDVLALKKYKAIQKEK